MKRAGTRQGGRAGRLAVVIAVCAVPLALAAALVVIIDTAAGHPPPAVASQVSGGTAAGRGAVDPGTPLPGNRAPGFTLTSQHGRRVSLSQFRGRAVVLAFVDARCTTVCPLTTASMTEAVSLLGPAAARRVQLLGINADPKATRVADVRAYSAAHQMMRSWDFLTGSERRLAAVWRAYHVYAAASHGTIDHEPAVYLIDAQGRERTLYLTQMAYASVGQQAQLLADGLSRILPGHPAPRHVADLGSAPSIGPRTAARLPVIGGSRTVRAELGPGHPHVVVFLASWLSEVSGLRHQLQALATYQRAAARNGWPAVLAIDETTTEATPHALAPVLARAGRLGYPVAADTSGRVADGYRVQSLPWIAITSSRGRVVYQHEGWLTAAALARAAARAARR